MQLVMVPSIKTAVCYYCITLIVQLIFYTTLWSDASCQVSLHVLALCAGAGCDVVPFIQMVPSEAPSLRLHLLSSGSAPFTTSVVALEADRTGAGNRGRSCSLLSLFVILSVRSSASSVLRSAALRGGFY